MIAHTIKIFPEPIQEKLISYWKENSCIRKMTVIDLFNFSQF